MSKRERIIVIAALGAAAFFLFDRFLLTPWSSRWDAVARDLVEKRKGLEGARSGLAREADYASEWEKLEAGLTADRRKDVLQALLDHINDLERRAKVTVNVNMSREDQVGDFREISLEISLRTTVEGLRNLLVEMYNSKEFLRISRLKVGANPFEKARADRLDVELKVSTIGYRPGGETKSGNNGGRKS